MANYKKWFDCLKFYALHKNSEDNQVGTKMFSKFVGEISHKLTSKPPDFSSDKAAIVEVNTMFVDFFPFEVFDIFLVLCSKHVRNLGI